jgi:hypothetical protein
MEKNVTDENKYSKTTDASMLGGALKAFGSLIRAGDDKRWGHLKAYEYKYIMCVCSVGEKNNTDDNNRSYTSHFFRSQMNETKDEQYRRLMFDKF